MPIIRMAPAQRPLYTGSLLRAAWMAALLLAIVGCEDRRRTSGSSGGGFRRPNADAGTRSDGGHPDAGGGDAGAPLDGGGDPSDGGHPSDGGAPDTGMFEDSGVPRDTGDEGDAGPSPDGAGNPDANADAGGFPDAAIMCPSPEVPCDGQCVDTSVHLAHCGGCNRPCGPSQVCDQSRCLRVDDCRIQGCAGLTWCNSSTGLCEPGCDRNEQCPPNSQCDLAAHACLCDSGYHDCSGACVADTSTDHCGSLCSPCPTVANGTATCDGVSCGVSCNTGHHDCFGLCSDDSSVATCGTSCTPCPAPPNAIPTCDGVSCGFSCAMGSIDCRGVCTADVATEVCDAQDDDCDGTVDEGCGTGSCASPVILQTAGLYTGQMSGTGSTRGSCGGNGVERVHVWRAPRSGTTQLSYTSDFWPAALYVRRATCAGTQVACRLESGSWPTVTTSFGATAGETYYVFVDHGTYNGPITLTYNLTITPPP